MTAFPAHCGTGGFVKWLALFLGISLALCWPAFLNGSPLISVDTLSHLEQGRVGVSKLIDRLAVEVRAPAERAATTGAGIAEARDQLRVDAAEANFLRTVAYSAFAYLTASGPFGLQGVALAQAAIVAALAGMLAGREVRNHPLAPVMAMACIAGTSAPFYVSTVMPDILAAVVILSAMIISARLEELGIWAKLALFGIASFAVMSHYGHLPLALATGGAALLVLLLQSRMTFAAIALALGPLAVAVVANLGVSSVLFEEPSVAPKRLPLLLARSMADGPAYWHLEKHCAEYRYAVCEIWGDDMPTDLGAILWAEDSPIKMATPEQMNRIRQEEMLILKRAFMDYPLEQMWSLSGNAISQLWSIGLKGVRWGQIGTHERGHFMRVESPSSSNEGLRLLGFAQKLVVLAAVSVICLYALRDGLRGGDREREILFVVVVGLLANAVIFGGLSAPVDRYQSRVIWIVPMLAAFFWLRRRQPVAIRRRIDV